MTLYDGMVMIREEIGIGNDGKGIGMPVVGIYDAYNFGHEEMERISDYYIADGEGLDKLIGVLN